MEWIWNKRNDKTIKKLLKAIKKGKEATDNFDFIADVRSGELCFDLIFREWDEDDYRLSTDLYVTGDGIKEGYGESENGKAYDFFGNAGYCLSSKDFIGMKIDEFKECINGYLTKAVTEADDFASTGIMGSHCNLLEKANKPLVEW